MIAWYRRWARPIEGMLFGGLVLSFGLTSPYPWATVMLTMLSGGFLTMATIEAIIAWRTRSS